MAKTANGSALLDALEQEAIKQIEELAAYRADPKARTDPGRARKAEIAVQVIESYTRLRATVGLPPPSREA